MRNCSRQNCPAVSMVSTKASEMPRDPGHGRSAGARRKSSRGRRRFVWPSNAAGPAVAESSGLGLARGRGPPASERQPGQVLIPNRCCLKRPPSELANARPAVGPRRLARPNPAICRRRANHVVFRAQGPRRWSPGIPCAARMPARPFIGEPRPQVRAPAVPAARHAAPISHQIFTAAY